jgi:hypothetical protein
MLRKKCFQIGKCGSQFLPPISNDLMRVSTIEPQRVWPENTTIKINFTNSFDIRRYKIFGYRDTIKTGLKDIDIDVELLKQIDEFNIRGTTDDDLIRYIIDTKIGAITDELIFVYSLIPSNDRSLYRTDIPVVNIVYEDTKKDDSGQTFGSTNIAGKPEVSEKSVFVTGDGEQFDIKINISDLTGNNITINYSNIRLGKRRIGGYYGFATNNINAINQPFLDNAGQIMGMNMNDFPNNYIEIDEGFIDIITDPLDDDHIRFRIKFSVKFLNAGAFYRVTSATLNCSNTNPFSDPAYGFIPGNLYLFQIFQDPLDGKIYCSVVGDLVEVYSVTTLKLYGNIFASTVMHEFMHVLGMQHSHQTGTNNPIETWNMNLLFEINKNSYNYIKNPINRNRAISGAILKNYTQKYDSHFPYDPLSIMSYKLDSDLITSPANFITRENYFLSKLDIITLKYYYGSLNLSLKKNLTIKLNYENYILFAVIAVVLAIVILIIVK